MADITSAAASVFGTIYNNTQAKKLAAQDRWENYKYGEMSANNADSRTRALYNDIYSPQALMKQYKEAGLSPAMMFGGTPGQGGMSGAQGNGAAGMQTPYMPVSILEAAQVANIKAQTDKTQAETRNINEDTTTKELQNTWQNYLNTEKEGEITVYNNKWEDEEGNPTSLYELAENYDDHDSFLQMAEKSMGSLKEYERRALTKIWSNSYYLNRDIAALTADKFNAEFSTELVEALQKGDFANKSAESSIQYLERNIQENKLEANKRKAWNDLLKKIEKKSKNGKDVLLILTMIADHIMTTYHMPNITPTTNNTYNSSKTVEINK